MRTERRTVDGLVGPIEVALDYPAQPPKGLAWVCHPHPLYGGTLDNKVASTLARAFVALGWLSVRPNFRGVGLSAGTHDEGRGETDDVLHLIKTRAHWLSDAALENLPQALAGFSFGSFVAACAAQSMAQQGQAVRHLVLMGAAAGKWPMPLVPPSTLVMHGEQDETIPLTAVLDWARPQELPIVVLPGADHFFHRRLSTLKQWVIQHVQAQELSKALHAHDDEVG